MFFGSKNPNLTLFFSCEHHGRAYERARAQINFKMHDVYRIICFLGKKAISDIIFFVRAPRPRTRTRARTKILKNALCISKYMFFGSRKPNLTLFFMCEQRERVHERARAQKYFKMHEVYRIICIWGRKSHI